MTDSNHNTPNTDARARGQIGRIVTLTIVGGLLRAAAAVIGPFAGAEEHVITGSVLAAFACSWWLLAFLTQRWTDQPQRWAIAPAAAMTVAAATMFLVSPTGNELGWVWPPALLALVAWMVVRSRHDLRSRARVLVLYPVFGALVLSALGGTYQTYRETSDPTPGQMPGRLIDVGGHRLHIDCSGTGSPTVVLEPGLGEPSPMMAAWIAPGVATTTRVCVYDRAGRGWSESAPNLRDGEQIANDLHTLLARAGEQGPYVLAGHSVGGIYVLNFAKLFPSDVAGVVLLDSMHPEQYTRMASWPRFYEMFRRASAAMPSLARLGVGHVAYGSEFNDLPAPQRDQERAFLATPRHQRSVRDEFNQIRIAMNQAAGLDTLGNLPLIVVTAERDADPDWLPMQDDLASLSTDSVHRRLPNATHAMVVEDQTTAEQSTQAILDVVGSIRTRTRSAEAAATTTAPPSRSLLPEPTGPEAVGTRDVPTVSPDATGRLWYPAIAGTGTGEPPYVSAGTAAALGLAPDALDDVHVRAGLDASPARTKAPRAAVVLMPGWGAPMAIYTTLAQDLASNGFVVLTIEPDLGAEEGNSLPADPSDPARWLEQLSAAIDFLTGPDVEALAGPVDPTRIAAGGHSIAGALAVQASLADSRIAAVFDLDGWLHGPALDTPVRVPALFVEASGFDEPTNTAIDRSTNAVTVQLADAAHFDVTDVACLAPALGPAADALGLGTIGCTGSKTTNALVERFLDTVLRQREATPSAADLSRDLAGIR